MLVSLSTPTLAPPAGTRHVFLPRSSSHAHGSPVPAHRMQVQSCWSRSGGFCGTPRRLMYDGAAATTTRPGPESRTWIMSRSMASTSRMPASNPPPTMSTSLSSTQTSSSTFGYRSTNRGSTRARISVTALLGTVSLTRPVTSPGRAVTVFSDWSACSTAGPAFSSRCCPASVSAMLRDVRVSSAMPRRSSSCLTDWLSADFDMPRSFAAAAKLRRRATARNELRALRGVKATVKVSYTISATSIVPLASAHASRRLPLALDGLSLALTRRRRRLPPRRDAQITRGHFRSG